jgi:hypothetical protein
MVSRHVLYFSRCRRLSGKHGLFLGRRISETWSVLFAGWTISETWQLFPKKYTNYYFSLKKKNFSTRINWLGFFLFNETTKELTYFIDGKTFVWIYIFLNICLSTKYLKWKINLSMIFFLIFFLTYFIDGKTFVWIYIFLNICLSTKYLKWKIYLWMIYFFLILDDTFFFSLFFRGENSSISSTWVVTKSYLRGIGPLRMLDQKWPEVTWPEVTCLFPLLSFLFGFVNRTFSWNKFYFLYLATS